MRRRARRGCRVLGIVLIATGIGAGASPVAPSGGSTERARALFLMGTRLEITLPTAVPEKAFDEAFAEVARLETILSNWRGESELSRLNRSAATTPFVCSPDLFGALQASLRFARETAGAFDPTVEPLVRRFGLRPFEGRLPGVAAEGDGSRAEDGAGSAAAVILGWRHVHLDPHARSAFFDAPGLGIDFGGIGKGIGLDAAARILARRGVRTALLDFGGQVLGLGAPRGEAGWPIGVAAPGDRERAALSLTLRDLSASTSGNDERSVRGPQGPIGQILDPARRAPASFAGTVTVLHREATAADALSTALFVMGPERGSAWAESRGLAALFLWRGPDGAFRRRATRAFIQVQEQAEKGAGKAGRRVTQPGAAAPADAR